MHAACCHDSVCSLASLQPSKWRFTVHVALCEICMVLWIHKTAVQCCYGVVSAGLAM